MAEMGRPLSTPPICPKHGIEKRRGIDRSAKSGLAWRCRRCSCESSAAWRAANPERRQESQRGYRRKNNRRNHLRGYYNITPEQYDEMLAAQGGVCGACGTDTPGGRGKHFMVDHDHACCPGRRSCGGCIRGLLCYGCNQAIARLGDTADGVRRALAYLEGSRQATWRRRSEM